jgi:hypothetical protein
MQFNRDWVAIGEKAGHSRQSSVLSWANRLADAAIHELCHWPEQASRAVANIGELSDDTTKLPMERLVADLEIHAPRDEISTFPHFPSGWDQSTALRLADVMINAVASSNAALRTHGSFATIARSTRSKLSRPAIDGVIEAARAGIHAEFADTFSADAASRHYEIWAVVGAATQQLPGYFPTTTQFLNSEVEWRIQHAPRTSARRAGPFSTHPFLNKMDSTDG